MAIQGLRDTSNFVTDERPLNWREGILMRYPNGMAPLFALTAAMKTRVVDDPEFNWWEKEMQTRRFQLGANLTAAGTTLTLKAGQNAQTLKAGDVLLVEQTLEQMRVVSDPSSATSIEVVRGWAGTSAATLDYDGTNINPFVRKLGSAYEEGSLSPTGIGYDPTKVYNYTQIQRDSFEATRTAMKTRLRTGDQVKEAKRECLELHSAAIEWSMWMGKRYEGTLNGKPIRTMNGIYEQINDQASSNIVTATAGGMDLEELEGFLKLAFDYGSSEKMAYLGNTALLRINQTVRKNTTWQLFTGAKEFGMNVTRLICPFGELVMKSHPLFNQLAGGTNDGASTYYGMDSWMFILDMANLTYVHLKDSDTKYNPDVQANGMDGMKSEYLTESSVEVHHAKTHFVIKNIIAAAADN